MQRMSEIKPFGLRIPDDLKTWLQERATANRRSVNSELLQLIETERNRAEQKEQA